MFSRSLAVEALNQDLVFRYRHKMHPRVMAGLDPAIRAAVASLGLGRRQGRQRGGAPSLLVCCIGNRVALSRASGERASILRRISSPLAFQT
jgi:hypothetical protein